MQIEQRTVELSSDEERCDSSDIFNQENYITVEKLRTRYVESGSGPAVVTLRSYLPEKTPIA